MSIPTLPTHSPLIGAKPAYQRIHTADQPIHRVQAREPSPENLPRLVGHLATAIAEVYCGTRAAPQLRSLLSDRELKRLTARSAARPSDNAPIRCVLSVRVAHPRADGVEVSAVVQGRKRCQAVAMRMRRIEDRWVAIAVDIQ